MAANTQSTPVTIAATSARRNFGEVVQRVFSGDEHFIVEKDGLPVVATNSMSWTSQALAAIRSRD